MSQTEHIVMKVIEILKTCCFGILPSYYLPILYYKFKCVIIALSLFRSNTTQINNTSHLIVLVCFNPILETLEFNV